MARTRQKRKAKQRREQQQQQQQQATRRDATAQPQPMNPAEEAVIQTAEALEAGDELEEIARGEALVAEPPPPSRWSRRGSPNRRSLAHARSHAPNRAASGSRQPRSRRRHAGADEWSASSFTYGPSCVAYSGRTETR